MVILKRGLLLLFILFFSLADIAATATPLPSIKPTASDQTQSTDATETATTSAVTQSDAIPHPKAKPLGTKDYLTPYDRDLYKKIFKAQDEGDWDTADKYTEKLKDMRLRGHIIYQRLYHPTAWRSSYQELYGWLDQYPDHPGAHEIYKLAVTRHVAGEPMPPKPKRPRVISGMMRDLNQDGPSYKSTKSTTASQRRAIQDLERNITKNLRRDRVTIAYNQLKQSSAVAYMDNVQFDTLQAQIAAGYLYVGLPEKALDLALASVNRSSTNVPLAGWVAGLASWKKGNYEDAYTYFQKTALSAYASTWTKAAGAYWASRAALRSGQFDKVSYWLNTAAEYERTFYGIMAIRSLSRTVDFNWALPRLTDKHVQRLSQYPEGIRAMLLIDAGQPQLAARELLRLHPGDDLALREALLAFAADQELPSFEIRFAHIFKNEQNRFYDAALYPLGSWAPKDGYKIDKAYIHAIARNESKFDHKAENGYSGAMGLMQILPSTANGAMNTKRFKDRGRFALKDPVTNVTVGQAYLLRLLNRKEIDGDIVNLTIAYNAGPGNLRRWQRQMDDINDPLLFIEMLPYKETRAYVERVLSNYWIYQMRLNHPTPTLDLIAAGKSAKLEKLK